MEKTNTHLTSKHVGRLLEDFQKGLSTGNLSTKTELEEYERIARDADDAIRCSIKEVHRHNTGYHRSPALPEAVAIVQYWCVHLQALRNALSLSNRKTWYATKNDLPLEILSDKKTPSSSIILERSARRSAKCVRTPVEISTRARRCPRFPNEDRPIQGSAPNSGENATKSMLRRINPIPKGIQSRAIICVKVPVHTWYYYSSRGELFEHRKGAFYSHSREHSIETTIFFPQTT